MCEQDNAGMAFPMDFGGRIKSQRGMTLRDYFAAKALPVAWQAMSDGYFCGDGWDDTNTAVAECAYQMADAMLTARDRS